MKLSDQLLKAAEFSEEQFRQWETKIYLPEAGAYTDGGADSVKFENARLLKLIRAIAPVLDAADEVDSMVTLIKRSNGKNSNLLFDLYDAHESLSKAIDKAREGMKNEPA